MPLSYGQKFISYNAVNPGATIQPAAVDVYTVKDHVINCNLSDIPAQITDVIWTPPTTRTDGYTMMNERFDLRTKSQVSTLKISVVKLIELRDFAESHTFTCKITVGFNNSTVVGKQNISIFNPSKNLVLNKLVITHITIST